MAKIFSLFIALAFTCALHSQTVTTVNVKTFENGLKKENTQLVDVRTPDEYKDGHLKGSKLMDWNNQQAFLNGVKGLDKSKPVYVYCLAGVRSLKAAEWLTKNGFAQVYSLDGGIKAWKEEGKAVVKE
jgi:rhodanese-related sulfurtransferase